MEHMTKTMKYINPKYINIKSYGCVPERIDSNIFVILEYLKMTLNKVRSCGGYSENYYE